MTLMRRALVVSTSAVVAVACAGGATGSSRNAAYEQQMKVVGPLTDPTAYGGKAEDAFDVVIPSLPGHGFSAKPTATGWDPPRIARAWMC